jgi:serine/threonine protein kinase/class 3 adenylate cyclase
MSLGSYELLSQVGAGPDGVSYRARNDRGRTVLLHDLARARGDVVRWPVLLRRVRTAALLTEPAAARVLEHALEGESPSIALEWVEPGPFRGEVLRLSLALALAQALVEAHRLGLAHGALGPASVLVAEDGSYRLDFSGVQTRSDSATSTLERADRRDDIRGLGAILNGLDASPGETGTAGLDAIVREMLADDREARPSAQAIVARLQVLADRSSVEAHTIDVPGAAPDSSRTIALEREPSAPDPALRGRLGRYRLLERLGQGGMGAVYRGEDLCDGAVVAIKVLRPEWAGRETFLRRFQKEARLLAEVNNPFVTNLLEVNEDDGIHFLVLEFVQGRSLGAQLAERGTLDESMALAIAADVARALADAHQRGIIHRDVKPENVLLAQSGDTSVNGGALPFRVKLSDFGLARHVVETESLQLTQASVVGTPQYMAPEQCVGDPIDPRADVYALGATLFHLLTGRPPFLASSVTELFRMHREEQPPPVAKLNPAVSEGACRIVAKALEKAPDDRFADAEAMLRDLERLLRGEPSHVEVHPRLPAHDPDDVLDFDFRWELQSPPRLLWPHVANTERLNRAIGLPAVDFSAQVGPDGRVRRFAKAKLGGLPAAWEEHPFEWVEPRRFGVLREYSRGPFKWVVSLVQLVPAPGGGTTLSHRVRFEPSHPLLRAILAAKIGRESRAALERVYRRIDAAVQGKLGRGGAADPFEEPTDLPRARRKHLDERLDALVARGVEPAVVEDLGEFLARAPVQEVSRIRPLALARRLGFDPATLVDACLIGAHEGLLVLLWDLLCPVCRIPSEASATLRELRDHGHCAACNLDYELDFANSIEMVFRIHSDIRESELGIFCIGGPAHSPHVVAQVRVAAGERLELALALPEGHYQVRGPQLPTALDLRIEPGAPVTRLERSLGHFVASAQPFVLRVGSQTLDLLNDTDRELIVRVERTAPRDDALTAARASALALFRELFPGELLAAGHQVRVATISLLLTELEDSATLYRDLGDARAFEVLREQFHILETAIRREGGALIKTVGEGVVAAFTDPVAAVRTGLDLQRALDANEPTRGLRIRVAIHRGPAMAATINEHLDYFGATVHQATRILDHAERGAVVVSGTLGGEPQVAALLRSQGIETERQGGTSQDGAVPLLLRLKPPKRLAAPCVAARPV